MAIPGRWRGLDESTDWEEPWAARLSLRSMRSTGLWLKLPPGALLVRQLTGDLILVYILIPPIAPNYVFLLVFLMEDLRLT